ncbi:YesL family protein [Saliterribacillus persicus]|uniref:Putative membrane protein YesL n=1 Tax=Saliterribacillus persicus TaxID=930114 RepID=A0A368YBB9_9BACI|nr:DUF624 domain-containing protein [Saliterribacillus persicus]RCW77543.1 putative membrane protein YesL [Saliterribacillus persicus]
MGFNGLGGMVYSVTLWIARLAYLNILWIVFTVAGIGLFGVFPATVSSNHLIRSWINGQTKPIFQTFFKTYKDSFISTNILGWSIAPIIIISVLLVRWSILIDHSLSLFIMIAFSFISVLFLFFFLFLMPVYTHYDVNLKEVYKHALYITIGFPHYAILMVLVWSIIIYILLFSGFFIFFFASSTSFVSMYISYKAFTKIKIKQAEREIMPT